MTCSWHVVEDTRSRKRRYPNDRKTAHHRDSLPRFPSQEHTASPMKPPHGFSMRGRPGPGDDDNGDYMSLLELGHEQDLMDIPDNMLAQLSQPDKKVDADFFNSFPDDFDEDDMRPVK